MTEGGPAGGAQARGDQDRHRGHLPAHPRAEEARKGLSGKSNRILSLIKYRGIHLVR